MKSAIRILISTFGGLTGFMGIEHGLGEVLQGNVASDGLMIQSWPYSDFFSILAGEPAMTVLPNMRVTGILAIFFSLVYLIWAVWFVQRKHGGLVLILLTVPMLLFGGGIFPPILGSIIGAAATRINVPLTWWSRHFSNGLGHVMGNLWPWLFGACLFSWLSMFPGVPVLYYFWGVENDGLIFTIIGCMFGFLITAGIAGFARDVQMRVDPSSNDLPEQLTPL